LARSNESVLLAERLGVGLSRLRECGTVRKTTRPRGADCGRPCRKCGITRSTPRSVRTVRTAAFRTGDGHDAGQHPSSRTGPTCHEPLEGRRLRSRHGSPGRLFRSSASHSIAQALHWANACADHSCGPATVVFVQDRILLMSYCVAVRRTRREESSSEAIVPRSREG